MEQPMGLREQNQKIPTFRPLFDAFPQQPIPSAKRTTRSRFASVVPFTPQFFLDQIPMRDLGHGDC
jgi:hypothetical protein